MQASAKSTALAGSKPLRKGSPTFDASAQFLTQLNIRQLLFLEHAEYIRLEKSGHPDGLQLCWLARKLFLIR